VKKNDPSTIGHKEYEENIIEVFEVFEEEQSPTIIMYDESEMMAADIPWVELLRCHYRRGHNSFSKLKPVAALGIFPSRLATVQPPKCAG
jgi:hypothetical protein